MGEVAQKLRAVRGMRDLGMELHAVEPADIVGDGGEWRPLAGRDNPETGWQTGDSIPVAHPDRFAAALCPYSVEQRTIVGDVDVGTAEFPMIGGFDRTTELMAQQLFAVTDAQDRDTEVEHPG